MEKQSGLFPQRTEIYVNRASETIPARKTRVVLPLDIRERIADVLNVKVDAASLQPLSLSTPLSEKVAMRALTCLMAIGAAERLVRYLALQVHLRCQRANASASEKSNSKDSHVHDQSSKDRLPLRTLSASRYFLGTRKRRNQKRGPNHSAAVSVYGTGSDDHDTRTVGVKQLDERIVDTFVSLDVTMSAAFSSRPLSSGIRVPNTTGCT